jgi:pSer/pThr/pTyr-binding forkhead associated (FHA) protein
MAGSPLDPHRATAAELKARILAERQGTPFLVYQDEDGAQTIVELSGSLLTVGRRPDNDVSLAWDFEVSRLHAQLEHIKDDWCLVDDGLSRNGSFVNGSRVRGRQRLRDGDRLCFGATMVVYRAPSESESKSTLTVPAPGNAVPVSETQRKVLVALCRPLAESAFAMPATNKAIADELFLSVDAVKAHLRVLFDRFGLEELPQNQKRASLAATALLNGTVAPHEL